MEADGYSEAKRANNHFILSYRGGDTAEQNLGALCTLSTSSKISATLYHYTSKVQELERFPWSDGNCFCEAHGQQDGDG